MTRTSLLSTLAILVLAVSTGCAHRVHAVGALLESPGTALEPGLTICVVKAPDTEDSEWDEEVSRKIERLLVRDGHEIASSGAARYYLFYEYRIKALLGRVRLQPLSGASSGMETVRRKGPYIHTLALQLVDADTYREREEQQIVWSGGAVLSDVPTTGPRFHDLLLVAAFDQFPQDTDETVTIKMALSDPRARKLRQR